jgi:hypothetical protein
MAAKSRVIMAFEAQHAGVGDQNAMITGAGAGRMGW